MKPLFIDIPLGKFQRCCFPYCDGDSVKELSVENTKGDVLYVSACSREGHLDYAEKVLPKLKKTLPRDVRIREGQLQESRVFIRPKEQDQKCRWDLWVWHCNLPKKHPEQVEAQEPTEPDEKKTTQAYGGWEWVGNFEKWQTVTGHIVEVSTLSNSELICAAQQICQVNYTRYTRRVAWVAELVEPSELYQYPLEELVVGSTIAGKKLDELKEIALERGLL